MRPLQSVLVGADDSAHSARALAFARYWTGGARISALHVVPVTPQVREFLTQANLSLEEAVHRAAEQVVTRTASQSGVDSSTLRILGRQGNPAEAVVHEFGTGEYDLAVVGSRGLGTIGELLLGSVSERLSRLGHGAVVVVK